MKFAVLGTNSTTNPSGISSFKPRVARAFCDGRKANADGVAQNENPFNEGREKENNDAWTAGWVAYAISATDKDHCAI